MNVRSDRSADEMYNIVESIFYLLQNLQVSKASGPNRIFAHMIKKTASSIAPSVAIQFNYSLHLEKLPDQCVVFCYL